jgi:hypothetical protein
MKKTPEKLSQTLSQVSSNQEKSAVPDSKEISHKIEKSPFAASLGVVELISRKRANRARESPGIVGVVYYLVDFVL